MSGLHRGVLVWSMEMFQFSLPLVLNIWCTEWSNSHWNSLRNKSDIITPKGQLGYYIGSALQLGRQYLLIILTLLGLYLVAQVYCL